jgi:hypothetical protein
MEYTRERDQYGKLVRRAKPKTRDAPGQGVFFSEAPEPRAPCLADRLRGIQCPSQNSNTDDTPYERNGNTLVEKTRHNKMTLTTAYRITSSSTREQRIKAGHPNCPKLDPFTRYPDDHQRFRVDESLQRRADSILNENFPQNPGKSYRFSDDYQALGRVAQLERADFKKTDKHMLMSEIERMLANLPEDSAVRKEYSRVLRAIGIERMPRIDSQQSRASSSD